VAFERINQKVNDPTAQKLTFYDAEQGVALASKALLAQWLERAAVNRKVTGSIPVGSVFHS
jgi:hypothetical protein